MVGRRRPRPGRRRQVPVALAQHRRGRQRRHPGRLHHQARPTPPLRDLRHLGIPPPPTKEPRPPSPGSSTRAATTPSSGSPTPSPQPPRTAAPGPHRRRHQDGRRLAPAPRRPGHRACRRRGRHRPPRTPSSSRSTRRTWRSTTRPPNGREARSRRGRRRGPRPRLATARRVQAGRHVRSRPRRLHGRRPRRGPISSICASVRLRRSTSAAPSPATVPANAGFPGPGRVGPGVAAAGPVGPGVATPGGAWDGSTAPALSIAARAERNAATAVDPVPSWPPRRSAQSLAQVVSTTRSHRRPASPRSAVPAFAIPGSRGAPPFRMARPAAPDPPASAWLLRGPWSLGSESGRGGARDPGGRSRGRGAAGAGSRRDRGRRGALHQRSLPVQLGRAEGTRLEDRLLPTR